MCQFVFFRLIFSYWRPKGSLKKIKSDSLRANVLRELLASKNRSHFCKAALFFPFVFLSCYNFEKKVLGSRQRAQTICFIPLISSLSQSIQSTCNLAQQLLGTLWDLARPSPTPLFNSLETWIWEPIVLLRAYGGGDVKCQWRQAAPLNNHSLGKQTFSRLSYLHLPVKWFFHEIQTKSGYNTIIQSPEYIFSLTSF